MKEILKSKIMILFILLVMGVTYINSEQIKMENNIQASSDGTVSKISVEKGASVLEGAELIVIG